MINYKKIINIKTRKTRTTVYKLDKRCYNRNKYYGSGGTKKWIIDMIKYI